MSDYRVIVKDYLEYEACCRCPHDIKTATELMLPLVTALEVVKKLDDNAVFENQSDMLGKCGDLASQALADLKEKLNG